MSYNKNYSPSKNERETPDELYNLLDQEFHFVADMAATAQNAKHECFFTKEDNSLSIMWPSGPVFCNPPYSRGLLSKFVAQAMIESANHTTPVLLLPVSTSSKWWFKYIAPQKIGIDTEIRFLRPRIPFLVNGKQILSKSGKPVGAMTPNAVVVFDPVGGYKFGKTYTRWWDWKEDKYY